MHIYTVDTDNMIKKKLANEGDVLNSYIFLIQQFYVKP